MHEMSDTDLMLVSAIAAKREELRRSCHHPTVVIVHPSRLTDVWQLWDLRVIHAAWVDPEKAYLAEST